MYSTERFSYCFHVSLSSRLPKEKQKNPELCHVSFFCMYLLFLFPLPVYISCCPLISGATCESLSTGWQHWARNLIIVLVYIVSLVFFVCILLFMSIYYSLLIFKKATSNKSSEFLWCYWRLLETKKDILFFFSSHQAAGAVVGFSLSQSTQELRRPG